jgi:hypothetical protein
MLHFLTLGILLFGMIWLHGYIITKTHWIIIKISWQTLILCQSNRTLFFGDRVWSFMITIYYGQKMFLDFFKWKISKFYCQTFNNLSNNSIKILQCTNTST